MIFTINIIIADDSVKQRGFLLRCKKLKINHNLYIRHKGRDHRFCISLHFIFIHMENKFCGTTVGGQRKVATRTFSKEER